MTKKIDAINAIKEIIEDMGYETRSYSGRGMWGDTCLGVSLQGEATLQDFLLELGFAITNYVYDSGDKDYDIDLCEELFQCLGRPKTDSMGLGMIIYFPVIGWDDSDD